MFLSITLEHPSLFASLLLHCRLSSPQVLLVFAHHGFRPLRLFKDCERFAVEAGHVVPASLVYPIYSDEVLVLPPFHTIVLI